MTRRVAHMPQGGENKAGVARSRFTLGFPGRLVSLLSVFRTFCAESEEPLRRPERAGACGALARAGRRCRRTTHESGFADALGVGDRGGRLVDRRSRLAKAAAPKRAASLTAPAPAKPRGPLTILVSLARQRLVLYDGDRAIASSPVSSGMAGHTTPTGVFSVIQKDRFHKSNIYSDAPMPFMQRITWSGIALHEGHLPGHPASHGWHSYAA